MYIHICTYIYIYVCIYVLDMIGTYNKIQNNPKPNYIHMYYKYQSCISSSHHTHIQNMYMSLYTITQHTHAYYVSRLYNVHTNQKYERCCL